MPQRTISNAGGNWNATTTWVEGAVPTTSDFVVSTATSGNLTVNVTTANIQYCDLSTYTGILTINSGINFNTAALIGSTTTLNAGSYNFLGTGLTRGKIRLVSASSKNAQQVTGSPVIPSLAFFGTTSLLNNFYVEDLHMGSSNIGTLLSNNIYVSGSLYTTESSTNSSTIINLIGTGIVDSNAFGGVCASGHKIVINTTGTYTFRKIGLILNCSSNFSTTAGQFQYIQGTIVNPILVISSTTASSGRVIIDCNGYNLEHITFALMRFNSTGSDILNRIECLSTLNCDQLFVTYSEIGTTSNSGGEGQIAQISGASLNISTLIFETSTMQAINNDNNLVDYDRSWILRLDPLFTHTIGSIQMGGNNSILTQKPRLASSTPSIQATISLGSNVSSYAAYSEFTDINIIGSTPLYSYFSTLTNTTGVTNLTSFVPTGGGGGETSHTFVS